MQQLRRPAEGSAKRTWALRAVLGTAGGLDWSHYVVATAVGRSAGSISCVSSPSDHPWAFLSANARWPVPFCFVCFDFQNSSVIKHRWLRVALVNLYSGGGCCGGCSVGDLGAPGRRTHLWGEVMLGWGRASRVSRQVQEGWAPQSLSAQHCRCPQLDHSAGWHRAGAGSQGS